MSELPPPTEICAGLSVVELGQGMAGPMAGMLLADHGADVVKVEPPGGDWARRFPGFRMWNRGKRSVVLDLTEAGARETLLGVVANADVVINAMEPGAAHRRGVDAAALCGVNPRLVHCSISGFGPATPAPDIKGYEGTVSAAMGRMMGLDRLNGAAPDTPLDRPIFTAAPTACFGAAHLAFQGILAALLQRRATGTGQRVETSLAQGAMAFLMRQELGPRGSTRPKLAQTVRRGIELCFLTVRCSDGRFLQMCARQDHHFRNWLGALDLTHLLDEPRFASAPLGIPTIEDLDEIEAILRGRMAQKTSDEWMEIFVAGDVGADPFLLPDEFLRHPEMVENQRVVVLDDPETGPTRMVGPLALLSATPARIETAAARLDADGPAVRSGARVRAAQSAPASSSNTVAPLRAAPPLRGITIVETAFFIAGPLATSLLAELGARVIKLEPLSGDPFRRTGLQAAKFLHGKESLAVDLKSPRGTEIVHRLLATADAFVHSFRPDVPARLSLDYPTCRGINERLVYLFASSYGSRGPWRNRAAFHSTPNALAGGGIMQAGDGNPPVDDSYPDPGAAIGAASALLLGLYAAQLLGVGQEIETTMLATTGHILSNEMVRYEGAPPLSVADRGQHGLSSCYRLYRCADGWIFVAAVQPHEQVRLAAAMGGTARYEERFASAPVADWLQHLAGAGVPAAPCPADGIEGWLARHGMVEAVEHPHFGAYGRTLPKVQFSAATTVLGPAAAVGEHSRSVLAEIGYSDDAIDSMVSDGVVGVWSAPRTVDVAAVTTAR